MSRARTVTRPCPAIHVKSGEPCGKQAQNLDVYCGYHSKREKARRSRDASEQWAAERLRKANEAAVQLIVQHDLRWCRARLFHALASAHEQGILVDVLDELFDGTIISDTADRQVYQVIANNVLQRWTSTKEG